MKTRRWILTVGLVTGLVLMAIVGVLVFNVARPANERAGSPALFVKGEPEPGDDHGGDRQLAKGEPQPGDDHGGDRQLVRGEVQPGDDHGEHV
jgi:hypothetical protein